jgi:hypothetical protein
MSHFYAGIHGSRGPATRQGTKESGISAYAQGWQSRLAVGFHYNATADQDDGAIQIGGGPSGSSSTRSIHLPDIDSIVAALDSGDPKIQKIWERIQGEFDKLSDEAHPAVLRTQRRQERAAKAQERERRRMAQQRMEILTGLDGSAKLALHKLAGIEWDANGNPMSTNEFGQDYGNLRYADDGETVLIQAKMPNFKRSWHRFTFDLTHCEWVLIDTPDFFGLDGTIEDSGYGWRVEEVAA